MSLPCLACASIGLLLPALAEASLRRSSEEPAVLFHGATFHVGFDFQTAVPSDRKRAEALLVREGRIIGVGTEAALAAKEAGRDARRVRLRSGHAFPGFQDAHVRLEALGASLEEVDLAGCESWEQTLALVRARAGELPAGAWVTGRGWDGRALPAEREGLLAALTAAAPDHPALLWDVDGGAALVNEAALQAAERSAAEPGSDPENGRIVRDEEGTATGLLLRSAVGLVASRVPAPDDEARLRRIVRAQEILLAEGVTCVHDMGVDARGLELRQQLLAEGRLRLRIVAYLDGAAFPRARDLEGLRRDDPMDRLTVGGVHLAVDGWLASRGAALAEPYADAPDELGVLHFEPDPLARRIESIARAGLQPVLRATGDRATRVALDGLERAAGGAPFVRGLRPRIELASLIAAADLKRFRRVEALASVQPYRAARERRVLLARVGPERMALARGWERLRQDVALPVSLGSGSPSGPVGPLTGLYVALTGDMPATAAGGVETAQSPGGSPRQTRGERADRLSADAALSGWTIAPAFAAVQEDRRGLIALGYFCDLTVVDADLTQLSAASAQRALDARVLMTVVNGEVEYTAP